MNKDQLNAIVILVVVLFYRTLFAQSATSTTKVTSDDLIDIKVIYRVSGESVSALRIDPEGQETHGHVYLGQHYLTSQRLRFLPTLNLSEYFKIKADFQLSAGYLAIDNPEERFRNEGDLRDKNATVWSKNYGRQFRVRKLYSEIKTPVGQVLLGRMSSQWGLGLFANAGDEDILDWGEAPMGSDYNYGDVVNRIVFATKPGKFFSDTELADKIILAFGADVLERDERFLLSENDFGWTDTNKRLDTTLEAIAALRYKDEHSEFGIYSAYRDIDDRNNDYLKAWAYDVFGKTTIPFETFDVFVAIEGVFVRGTTTIARNNAVLGALDIQQLGYVLRTGIEHGPTHLAATGELGYASGDSNPNDGHLRNFTFDPNYQPSLILFRHLHRGQTVAAAANAKDPDRVGQGLNGTRLLPSNGAVTNAIYFKPALRYHTDNSQFRISLLWARSEEDFVDPYHANIQGGSSRNYQGGSGTLHDLGIEVNVGYDYTVKFSEVVAMKNSLQLGHLWPGPAFSDQFGREADDIRLIYLRTEITW